MSGPTFVTAREEALPAHLAPTYALIADLARAHDGRATPPISRQELAERRGLARRTIDEHLRELRRRGYVRNAPGCQGGPLVLLLRPEDDPPPAAPAVAAVADRAPDQPLAPASAQPVGIQPSTKQAEEQLARVGGAASRGGSPGGAAAPEGEDQRPQADEAVVVRLR